MWTRIGNWYPLVSWRARANMRRYVDGLDAVLPVGSALGRRAVPAAA